MAHVSERGATREGQHRDLSDALTQVDKKQCWFKTMVKKGTAPMNTLGEWPLDDFDDVNTSGVVDDKDETEFEDAFSNYGLLKTYLQVLRRKPKVGNLQQKVANPAGIGRKKSMAKAIAKKLIELGRDIEATCLSDNEAQEGVNTTTPYMTRGLLKWTDQEHTVLPIPEQFRTPAAAVYSGGALAAFAESDITNMLKARWDEVGEPANFVLATGSSLRTQIATFSIYAPTETDFEVVRRFNSNKADTLTRKVSVVDTEFGMVTLRNSSFINVGGDPKSVASKRQGIGFDSGSIQLRFAENPSFEPLPDLGGGPRGLIEAIIQLRPSNPKDLIRINPNA